MQRSTKKSLNFHQLTKRFFGPVALLIVGFGFILRLHHFTQPTHYIFDEDYHAFTAWQEIQHPGIMFQWWHSPYPQNVNQFTYRQPAIEWLHPPLTKYLWILSIKLSGNNSFAWRLPSVIFGSFNIVLVIWLTFLLTKQRELGLFAGLLMAGEPLEIAQSQIAMNDVFLTSWILLATIFYSLAFRLMPLTTNRVKKYPRKQQRKEMIFLVTAASFLGLATATKWTGFWLLPIFFVHFLFVRMRQLQTEKKVVKKIKRLILSSLTSFGLFLLIPGLIYFLSYTPMFIHGQSLGDFVKLHQEIFHYQTTVRFNHPNQSQPWQWAIGQKPVYYALKSKGDSVNRVAQVNPILALILTGGLFVSLGIIIKTIYSQFRTPNSKLSIPSSSFPTPGSFSLFTFNLSLSVMFWLPWFFIHRPKFIYYFTPIIPLLIINLLFLVSLFYSTKR